MESEIIKKNIKIKNFYQENMYVELEEEKNKIEKKLEELFLKYKKEYKLIQENSIYKDIKLYNISGRVKNKDSLYEKLFRNNINIKDDEEKIKDELIKIGDLIGIKIATTLRCDCENAFRLINDKITEKNMKLLRKENEEIPSTMKNKRKIYKMNIQNEGNTIFELQIKSNIDSSWSDIEHSLFYKDYDYTAVKSNNHQIMLNVGNILDNLEETMQLIRNSKSVYTTSEEKEKYFLFEEIENKFADKLMELYGITFQLSSLISVIKYFKEKCGKNISQNFLDQEIELYKFFKDAPLDTYEKNLEAMIFNEIDTRILFHIFTNMYSEDDKLECFFYWYYDYIYELYREKEEDNSESYIKIILPEIITNLLKKSLLVKKDFLTKEQLKSFFNEIKKMHEILEKKWNSNLKNFCQQPKVQNLLDEEDEEDEDDRLKNGLKKYLIEEYFFKDKMINFTLSEIEKGGKE